MRTSIPAPRPAPLARSTAGTSAVSAHPLSAAASPATAAGHDFGRVSVRARDAGPIQMMPKGTGAGKKPKAPPIPKKAKKGTGPSVTIKKPVKAKRNVTKLINDLSDKTDDVLRDEGALLGKRSAKVWSKWLTKAEKKRKADFDTHRKAIENAPSTFKGSTPVLAGSTPFEQMHALTTSTPQAFKVNLGGTAVELDAAPSSKKGRKDGDARGKTIPRLPTTFLDTGKNKSYEAMVNDPHTSAASQTPGEKLLPHLEVKRNPEAAFNVYAKDALFHGGHMDKSQRFDDVGPTTFMEMKGATKPTKKRRRVQEASSAVVAKHITDAHDAALKKDAKFAGFDFGSKVSAHPLANSSEFKAALETFRKDPKKKAGKKALNKQLARIFRSATQIDAGSDSEMDTDDDA